MAANDNQSSNEPYYYFQPNQPQTHQAQPQQQQHQQHPFSVANTRSAPSNTNVAPHHPTPSATYQPHHQQLIGSLPQPQQHANMMHSIGMQQAPLQSIGQSMTLSQQQGGMAQNFSVAGIHHSQQQQQQQQQKRKEIYRYNSPFEVYATAWSSRLDAHLKFRLAVGSFIEEYNNKISIVQLHEDQGEGGQFAHIGTFEHPYPATKVLWIPDPKSTYPDLLATTGDYLRLWRVGGHNGAVLEVLLNNNRSSEYCAPLTSADWNEVDVSLIGTSSIDTTCTIWQIETGQAIATTDRAIEGSVKTQLIAHDKEVFDIEFSKLSSGREIFASAGADGSVRLFDLRHMEYSTIVFEEPNRKALLRIAWNKQDHNYLATFAQNSNEVYILDIRIPSMPVSVLKNHTGFVNGIAWAPHSTCHICSAAEDCQALIWDVHSIPRPVEDPILAYAAGGEINQVHWSSSMTDWISICYDKSLELLRV